MRLLLTASTEQLLCVNPLCYHMRGLMGSCGQGCFAACPDPVDFRAYGTVDIYADDNAYFCEHLRTNPLMGTGSTLSSTVVLQTRGLSRRIWRAQ